MDITEPLHHMHMGGHCVCVCLHVCICVGLCSKTCVRLLAVLWGIACLGSFFRKPNTGTGSWELGTSSGWLMTTGGLASVAIWGDNNQPSNKDIIKRQWVPMYTGYLVIEKPLPFKKQAGLFTCDLNNPIHYTFISTICMNNIFMIPINSNDQLPKNANYSSFCWRPTEPLVYTIITRFHFISCWLTIDGVVEMTSLDTVVGVRETIAWPRKKNTLLNTYVIYVISKFYALLKLCAAVAGFYQHTVCSLWGWTMPNHEIRQITTSTELGH